MDELFAGLSTEHHEEAPVIEQPAAPPTDTPVPDADQVEADEWAKVAEDMFPGLDKENNDEQNTGKESEETGTPQGDNSAPKPGEDTGKPGEEAAEDDTADADAADAEDEQTGPPELSASDRQQLESDVKAEVTQKMFTEELNGKPVVTTPDGSKYALVNGRPTLADADGDPVRTIDDVMKLINPRTGEQFTEEQAGMWLLNAQNRMRDNITDMNTRVEEIASTGLALKDESENVAYNYGELLKAMPELQQEIWADYEKTLVKDPKTGIVTKAPVSLQKFYERALEPYAELGRRLEAQGSATPATPAAPAATPPAPAQSREQRRQDRSDIYGGGKVDDVSDDDKEWGAAAAAVFGDQLKGLRR